MTTMEQYYDDQFEQFLDELCLHVRIVGGTGNPERFRAMTLFQVYKELRPNNIIIGFRNLRMKKKYQLSHQMKTEVLYDHAEEEFD